MSEGVSHGTMMKTAAVGAAAVFAGLLRYIYGLQKKNERLSEQLAALAYHTSQELKGTSPSSPTSLTDVDRLNFIEHDKPVEDRTYEQNRLVREYLLMHYGEDFGFNFAFPSEEDGKFLLNVAIPNPEQFGNVGVFNIEADCVQPPNYPVYALNFPARVAELAIHFFKKSHPEASSDTVFRALDVGCSVGRTTFDLTKYFKQVIGLDYSYAFVNAATELKEGKELDYTLCVEGEIRSDASVVLDDTYDRNRVSFVQGDATNLSIEELGGKFDCIVAANLIDRLPCPRLFLECCEKLISSGGLLVLTSPYTWLEEFTPKSEWLQSPSGSTFEALRATLSGSFELLHDSHMPFLIRETGRKHQFTFAHATVWKRK